MKSYDTIILGGGLAGLSCADELLRNKKNHKVLLLEKNNYLGGLSATFKWKDFLFDLAPHRWFTKNEELESWIKELMADELISVKKYTPMYQFGKLYHYPIKITDVLKKVGVLSSFIMFFSYMQAKVINLISDKKVITMEDAYINRFGKVLYQWFNVEYNEKLWGKGGCKNMSADFVDQRVKNLSLISVFKNALGLNTEKIISLVDSFMFPKKGIGRISENLKKRITENNGEIILGIKIQKIQKDNGYIIKTSKGDFTTTNLISSIPIDSLIGLIDLTDREIIKETKKLNYINQKIVILFIDRPKLTDFTWVYVHPSKIKFFRFLETNNWSKEMSPKGKTSFVFEYPYQKNDEIDKMTDKKLISLTINDFKKYFVPRIKNQDILKTSVFYVDKAYPKYDLDYLGSLTKIKEYLKQNYPNLQIVGRNGMFRYNNMDHSVYTGILAARNIIEGKNIYDLNNVNNEAEYLEEKKI